MRVHVSTLSQTTSPELERMWRPNARCCNERRTARQTCGLTSTIHIQQADAALEAAEAELAAAQLPAGSMPSAVAKEGGETLVDEFVAEKETAEAAKAEKDERRVQCAVFLVNEFVAEQDTADEAAAASAVKKKKKKRRKKNAQQASGVRGLALHPSVYTPAPLATVLCVMSHCRRCVCCSQAKTQLAESNQGNSTLHSLLNFFRQPTTQPVTSQHTRSSSRIPACTHLLDVRAHARTSGKPGGTARHRLGRTLISSLLRNGQIASTGGTTPKAPAYLSIRLSAASHRLRRVRVLLNRP